MKKTCCTALLVVLLMFLATEASAITEGDYEWEGNTIAVTVNEQPMFAPVDMGDDQRAIGLIITVPDGFLANEANRKALYRQAVLMDADGSQYRPGSATSRKEASQLTYLYAIPKDTDSNALTLDFVAENAIPVEYIGTWAGTSGNISLVFEIRPDSRAVFTFTQGNYTDSSDVALSVEDETFTVEVPEDDALGTVACGGTYSYHDGILTLKIENTFINGHVFAYTVHCERVDDSDQESMSAPSSTADVFPIRYEAYGRYYTYTGYSVGTNDEGKTTVTLYGSGNQLGGPIHEWNGVPFVEIVAGGQTFSWNNIGNGEAMLYTFETSEPPETITITQGNTGDLLVSFNVDDVTQK